MLYFLIGFVDPPLRVSRRAFLASAPLEAFGHSERTWAFPCVLPSGQLRYQRLRLSVRGLVYDVVGPEVTTQTLLQAPSQGTSIHWTFDELQAHPLHTRGRELTLVKTRGLLKGHVRIAVPSVEVAGAVMDAVEQACEVRQQGGMTHADVQARIAMLGQITASVSVDEGR